MTALPTEILEQLREIDESAIPVSGALVDEPTVMMPAINLYRLLSTVKAIVGMPVIPDIGHVTGIEDAINHGRNLNHAEVLAKIAEGLGRTNG